MKRTRSHLWLGALIVLPQMMFGTAAASTVLLRSAGPAKPELAPIETYAGKAPAIVSPVKAEDFYSVVLLLDTLKATELESLGKELSELYDVPNGHSMRIILVRNGAISVQGPFASQGRLKSVLEKIQQLSGDTTAIPPEAVYDGIAGSVSQWGSNWSRVLLAGNLPELPRLVREYAAGILLRAFCIQHVQVSLLEADGKTENWTALFESTGGAIVNGDVREYYSSLKDASQSLFQVEWKSTQPPSGFVISRSVVSNSTGQMLFNVSEVVAHDGSALPTVTQYAVMEASLAEVAKLLEHETLSATDGERIRANLRAALAVNPLEPGALLIAATYNEKQKNFAASARFRELLTEVQPLNGTAFASLGHALLLAGDNVKAEKALKHAAELDASSPAIAEDLARVRAAHNDEKGAPPRSDGGASGDAKGQERWFLEAHDAERRGDTARAMEFFERGLALGGVHIPECGALLKLYLDAKQVVKAQDFVKSQLAGLPPDAAVRMQFAGILDELRQNAAALLAWRRVLEVQPTSELAHTRIAKLLLESGDARASEHAADEGLEAVPKSAELYIARADALEAQRKVYEAREAIEQGADAVGDLEMLRRLAYTEDSYGGSAAEGYARLLETLDPSSPDRLRTLQRAFTVAVRDGDMKRSETFSEMLEAAGDMELRRALIGNPKDLDHTAVAGGLDALAFVAHAKEGTPPERFFAEYCRALIERRCTRPGCSDKEYTRGIEEHFQRVAALEALGRRDGASVTVTLSLQGQAERQNAEQALNLLGIKMRSTNGQIELGRGEKKKEAKKQETTSALAVDEVGIQEALQAGKPYKLEIQDESAAVYPNERIWRENFYPDGGGSGGFATALLRTPKMARLYVGLSSLEKQTVATLLSAVDIKTLAENDADLIFSYAPAFALQGTHAAVPGGAKAEPIWAALANADPAQPGRFFAALLQQADGRLLAYFFTISQLDLPHQAFFTSSLSRTTLFYELFSQTEEMRRGASTMIGNSTFIDFLRSVPLDSEGHVNFPGSARVWMAATGRSPDAFQGGMAQNKTAKTATPEVEDLLLLTLAQTRYKSKISHRTELENFLAVARIDSHRENPLDEQAALILAQNYSDFYSFYAYFTDITEIGAPEYAEFFTTLKEIRAHSSLDANLQLGQVHSLVEWICLLARRRVIGAGDASKLFRFVSDRFAAAKGPAAYTAASLDSARSILTHCQPAVQAASADERIRRCLLGPEDERTRRRHGEFERVLELQKVPSLEALLSIYERVGLQPGIGRGDFAAVQTLAAALPRVEIPKSDKLFGKDKEILVRYDPAPVQKIASQLSASTGRNHSDEGDVERLSQELLAQLQPHVTLALSGQIYAYFLRPADLLVSEDPFLIRKHHYLGFPFGGVSAEKLPESDFEPSSSASGSNFIGSFAQFGMAAGTAAAVGWKTAGPAGELVIAAQIAALRSTDWDTLDESDLRLLGLRCTLGREWIEESATHPDAFQALSEETMGLLSLSRRADLLSAIETRNWPRAWDAVTLPDLFALGGRFSARFHSDPWRSPTIAALRQLGTLNDGSRLNMLGGVPYHAFGCNHPHLVQDAPYEDYERRMFPTELAERTAEFKLFLVYLADSIGVEPWSLSTVAEPLAAKAFRNAKVMDDHDWRDVTVAFASISATDLKEALEQ